MVDHALWPHSGTAAHAQSIFWYALVLLAAAWVFRSFLPAKVAGLALLIFAVDDRHGPARGWLSNRHEMISLALALPALALHHLWRRDGWKPGALLASIALACGLFAGESAIAVTAFLAAYALHIDRGTWKQRALTLAPYATVIVLWRIAYAGHGYGARNSGLYFDPIREPVLYLSSLPTRAIALLASQLALPWSDFVPAYKYISPALETGMLALAIFTVVGIGRALWPVVRREPALKMFATGALLALLPPCATFPTDRLLLYVGVGGAAIIAMYLVDAKSWRPLVWLLVFIHLIFSAPFLALRSRSMATVDKPIEFAISAVLPAGVGRTVVIVNAPADPLAGYIPLALAARDEPRPEYVRWLESGSSALDVTRTDDRTLLVHADDGFYQHESEQLLRSPTRPIALGTRVELTGLSIEVTGVRQDGRASDARFRFDRPLEDPSFVWLWWHDLACDRWVPPPVGQTARLPSVDFTKIALATQK